MKLFAISDLHLNHNANRQALADVERHPEDWIILAGDVGETCEHLAFAFGVLRSKFRQIVWVPGNHELWTVPGSGEQLRGQFKYEELVALCRTFGVLTPEDPYPTLKIGNDTVRVVPLFLLYDYSFRPADIPPEQAVAWARESGIDCTDEMLLHADPFPGIAHWCHDRLMASEARLRHCNDGTHTVLINHFPLRQDLVRLPTIPRFSVWCGTRRTENWHLRFNAAVVVSGHLHTPSTCYRDGVRFEEVSLGYPRQWAGRTTVNQRVREILPQDATRQDPLPNRARVHRAISINDEHMKGHFP